MRISPILALALLLTPFAAIPLAANPSPVSISVVSSTRDRMLPEDFSGLSFETQRLLPEADGQYFFRADNQRLVALFRTLGIKCLRIGGNTADRPSVPIPSTNDIDSLFAFARVAGVKVIYTLRLREGDPRQDGTIAKYILDHYSDSLWCFAIGNEPNVFAPEFPQFLALWKKFADVVNSPEFAPSARFAGPSSTAGKNTWTRDFAKEFKGTGRLVLATQHIYPGGNADLVADPAEGRALMLSRDWIKQYQTFHDGFVPGVLATGTPYRLGETNSFWNGGRKDVSNTFAASLWALDYMNWWAAHGANGLNFHTGDYVAKAEENTRCMYAAFWTTENGYEAKPVAYALKSFELAGPGQLSQAIIDDNPAKLNVTAYAVRQEDLVTLTVINKEFGTRARSAELMIAKRLSTTAQIIRLSTPDGNIARTDGITLGNAAITSDGTWDGQWSPCPEADYKGQLTVVVPPASAVLVKFMLP